MTGDPTASIFVELKNMLESFKDDLKLEATKKLVTMIAKGKSETMSVLNVSYPRTMKSRN